MMLSDVEDGNILMLMRPTPCSGNTGYKRIKGGHQRRCNDCNVSTANEKHTFLYWFQRVNKCP